jgi:hypothetical protein
MDFIKKASQLMTKPQTVQASLMNSRKVRSGNLS